MTRKKMDEETLLSILQDWETDSSDYTFGTLQQEREQARKEYYQRPYGNEEIGWSQAVTSDVQDTVEWILPDLLDLFVSTDDAVVFDPTRASEAEGAQQATDTCNYVFHKQNNGVLLLTSLFKDTLIEKTGIAHWYKQTKRVRESINFAGVTLRELAMLKQDGDEVVNATPLPPEPLINQVTGLPMLSLAGQPVMAEERWNIRIARVTERRAIKVDTVPPENLLVARYWTSPLLDECPYVARLMEVTLSDLNEMAAQLGFDEVTADDLSGSAEPASLTTRADRTDRTGSDMGAKPPINREGENRDDESQTTGWLRIEWVLADYDGDGISERRCIYRLEDKILYNEECDQVPVAVGTAILVPHQWDGKSPAELVSDIQRIRTDLMRALLNNAQEAANPRKTVTIDSNGAPMASIDDLLDYRPGGITRVKSRDALGIESVPFVAQQIFPIMEYMDQMRQQRTGVTRDQQGLDPNSLRGDRTAKEVQILSNAARQRVKLIARILAETLMKPIMRGILKLLTEGDMEEVAFRLRGKFVAYNPNEWRDSYDMTANVGTGTGDREQKLVLLNRTAEKQLALAASPLGAMMVTPRQIYQTEAQILDLGGFKDVDKFWTDPKDAKLPEKPPEPLPPQVLVKQMELAAEQQMQPIKQQQEREKLDAEYALKEREAQNAFTLQQQNDERDAEREARQAEYDYNLELARVAESRYKTDADNRRAVQVAHIAHPESQLPPGWGVDPETGAVVQGPDPFETILQGMDVLNAKMDAPVEVVRDPATGQVLGAVKNGRMQQVVRDESGRVTGLQ